MKKFLFIFIGIFALTGNVSGQVAVPALEDAERIKITEAIILAFKLSSKNEESIYRGAVDSIRHWLQHPKLALLTLKRWMIKLQVSIVARRTRKLACKY